MSKSDGPASAVRGRRSAETAIRSAVELVSTFAEADVEALERATRYLTSLMKACQAIRGVAEALGTPLHGAPDDPTDVESERRLRRALHDRIAALVAALPATGADGAAVAGGAETAGLGVAGPGARGPVAPV